MNNLNSPEVSTLLNHRSHIDTLVPPSGLGNRLVRTSVTSNGSHHRQVVLVDDLLHLLDAAEVTKHVADRDNVTCLDEAVCHLFGDLDVTSGDGLKVSIKVVQNLRESNLFDKVGRVGEHLEKVDLKVVTLSDTTTELGRAANDDGAETSAIFSHKQRRTEVLPLGSWRP